LQERSPTTLVEAGKFFRGEKVPQPRVDFKKRGLNKDWLQSRSDKVVLRGGPHRMRAWGSVRWKKKRSGSTAKSLRGLYDSGGKDYRSKRKKGEEGASKKRID